MTKEEIELKLTLIDQIEKLCSELIEIENPKQSDKDLIDLLKKEYTLSKEDKNSILSVVKGKKKGESSSKKEVESLKTKLSGFCVAAEISMVDRQNNPLTYQRIKTKVQNNRNGYKKKLKDLEG